MVKLWLAGAAGLMLTSAVAVAQDVPISSSSTTTTVQTAPTQLVPVVPVAPATTTTVRVDRSASQENGQLVERTRTYETRTPASTVVVPSTTQTTTVERTVTVPRQ